MCARIDVAVNVDEAGRDEEARDVDRLDGIGGVQVRRHGDDVPVLHTDVGYAIEVVARIDHASVLQQQIVGQGIGRQRTRRPCLRQCMRGGQQKSDGKRCGL